MNSGSTGSFNRLIYDNCAYQKSLYESTDVLKRQLYEGAYEHCDKCIQDENSFYRPFDLVDIESELKNITRANSKCPQNKYNPACKKSGRCTSTFDKSVPVVLAQEVCPIVQNNIIKMTTPGYIVPTQAFCGKIKRNNSA